MFVLEVAEVYSSVQNFIELSAAVRELSSWQRNREHNLATMMKTVVSIGVISVNHWGGLSLRNVLFLQQ